MNDNIDDQDQVSESGKDGISNEFQMSVRSNILKRIYEKNLYLNSKIENGYEKIVEDENKKEKVINKRMELNPLTNDWRKTLERILNYDQNYLENQLDVNRKDALRFFIQKEWTDDEEKNRKSRKQKNKKERPILFVQRQQKVSFAKMFHTTSVEEMLTYDDNKLKSLKLERRITEKGSLYERFITGPLQSFDYLHELSYLFRRNESSKIYRLVSWFYEWFIQHAPSKNQIFESKQQPGIEPYQMYNNNMFVLEICSPEIVFNKHSLMSDEQKQIRQLNFAFERYKKTIENIVDIKLDRLEKILNAVVSNITKNNAGNGNDERKLDLNLAKRLFEYRQELILNRRKALIELLRIWDRVVSHKSTSKLVSNNSLNLLIEELTENNEESERTQLEMIINQNINWKKSFFDGKELKFEQVKSNTYLLDGRLPGEPKFSNIELHYENDKNSSMNKSENLDIGFITEIHIGERIISQCDWRSIPYDFSNLNWNRSCSIPLHLKTTPSEGQFYRPLIQDDGIDMKMVKDKSKESVDNLCKELFPHILIFEKSSKKSSKLNKERILLWEQIIEDLPSFEHKSIENSKIIEFEFEYNENNNETKDNTRTRIKGIFRCKLYWSKIPYDIRTLSASNGFELLFDKEKRHIEQITKLDSINQLLHDLRYLDVIDLKDLSHESNDSMRQIKLMDYLLRQKYQIELDNSLMERNKPISPPVIKHNHPNQNLPLGDFCTDDDINQNKRFQLMLLRQSKENRNYHKFRFIPLTNVTDVMLKNVILGEKTEQLSLELIINYLKSSSAEHSKRLTNIDKKKRKKKKNQQENENKIYNEWCMLAPENRLFMNWQNCFQIIEQAFDKLQQEQNVDMETSDGHYYPGKIMHREDIIQENVSETFDASEFSFFIPFFNLNGRKLNPSRKDRRKVAITLNEAIDKEVEMVLTVNHAINVPLRMMSDDDETNDDEDEDLGRFGQCSTFVEIIYDDQSIVTTIGDGAQPTWNETFRFKVKLNPNKYIILNLIEVVKSARSNSVSSEASTDIKSVYRNISNQESECSTVETFGTLEYKKNDVYMHFEKRYLGQLRVPLFAILFNCKIEGTFFLHSPYFMLGYRSTFFPTSESTKKSKLKLNESTDERTTKSGTGTKMLTAIERMRTLYSNGSEQTLLDCLPDIGLAFFLTIDPPIDSINGFQFDSKIARLESPEMIEQCNRWRNQLSALFHNRHYISLVKNAEYKLVLACRFLAPIKPPDLNELIQLEKVSSIKGTKQDEGLKRNKSASLKKLVHREALYLSMLIRFVSQIPAYIDNCPNIHSRLGQISKSGSIWLDSVQFLSLRVGFQVEHAIYLCCMLQYLDRMAYLVFGTSFLEGPVGYVILYPGISLSSLNDNIPIEYEPIIINPRTGQQFGVRDCNITINSIDCIITNQNIYGNIQKNSHPNSMQYNFKKLNQWLPLFNQKDINRFKENDEISKNCSTIQPEFIDYSNAINHESIRNYESKLECYLRDQLIVWRRKQSATFTAFNRYCTQLIRRTLPKLELHACLASANNGSTYAQLQQMSNIEETILEEMGEMSSLYRLVGYPLHVSPMINFEHISHLIYSIGLHSIGVANGVTESAAKSNTEFVISAYVHPYPANVYSVWIYIGALVPKT